MDTNSDVIQRKSVEERELGRKEQLKEEVTTDLLCAIPVLPVPVACTVSLEGVE